MRVASRVSLFSIALLAWSVAASSQTSDVPVANSTSSVQRPLRLEPGLEDRHARYGPSTSKKIAMLPVHLLELPFVVVNYPFEKWIVRKQPLEPVLLGLTAWRRLRQNGILIRWGGFGPNAGAGGGLGYRLPESVTGRSRLQIFGGLTSGGYEQFYAQFDTPQDADLRLDLRGEFFDRGRERFYGVGLQSSVDDRSSYDLATTRVRARVDWNAWTRLHLQGAVAFSRHDVHEGEDERYPTAQELFPGVEGLEGRFDFVEYGAALSWEGRDSGQYASRGTYARAAVRLAEGVRDTDNAYTKYSFELQHYLPLPGVRRVLALRFFSTVTDNRSGPDRPIPLFRLETLGGPNDLRGYRDSRFTDKDIFFGNVEYRFPFWWIEHESGIGIDALAFFDYGTALPNLEKMQQRDFRSSSGLGFRVMTYHSFLGQVDFGWTPEGSRVHAGLRWNFNGLDDTE